MDPRVIQRSLLRDAPPPPPFVAPEPAPTPPPPTAKDARRHLAKAVADHQDALAQLDRLTAAQSRARTACVDASSAVVSAEAMLEEAQQNEPKSYISRLLSNGDAAPPVDLVETALEIELRILRGV